MPPFKLSKKAFEDLLDIGKYTAKKWGIPQRNRYLKQLDNSFFQISDNPGISTECDYISSGYRKFPQGSHLIFYKINAQHIVEIIRVLHQSIDIGSEF